jgi:hypothetical protein
MNKGQRNLRTGAGAEGVLRNGAAVWIVFALFPGQSLRACPAQLSSVGRRLERLPRSIRL